MKVAGVEVATSALAELTVRLHRVGEYRLSNYIGRAIDNNRRELWLDRDDRAAVLRVMADSPDGLTELRGALIDQHPRG